MHASACHDVHAPLQRGRPLLMCRYAAADHNVQGIFNARISAPRYVLLNRLSVSRKLRSRLQNSQLHAHTAWPCCQAYSNALQDVKVFLHQPHCLPSCRQPPQQRYLAQHRCETNMSDSTGASVSLSAFVSPNIVGTSQDARCSECPSTSLRRSCCMQDFPIPEAKLIQLAQELFAKDSGVSDESLLADDFRCLGRCLLLNRIWLGVAVSIAGI